MEVRAHITYRPATEPSEDEVIGLADELVERLHGYGPVVSGNLKQHTTTVTIAYDTDRLGAAVPLEHLQAIATSFSNVGLGIPRLVAIEQVDAGEPITHAAA